MELAEPTCAQNDRVYVNRKDLETVLQQCQLALHQLTCGYDDGGVSGEGDTSQDSSDTSSTNSCDTNTTEFNGLLESRFECADFLKKLENAHALPPKNTSGEGSSWDMVSKNDLGGGRNVELEIEDYILVQQEDVIEGVASFMAAYLLSLEQSKDLTPNQLQEALKKTFSIKRKSKLKKAWDGSRVIYNLASWGATAVGMYENPALVNTASAAFRASRRVISKLL